LAKALKRQGGINWHFIYEIMEIGEKEGERSQVACEEEIEGN